MEGRNVVYLEGRRAEPKTTEFAVLFRVRDGSDAQFKVFAGEMGEVEKAGLASAMEAAARILRA